jgi:hypothetical protein
MDVLLATSPLPHRPRRVLVAGTSGSGKTTLAGRIAALLGIAQVEIDAFYHGPGWVARDDFVGDVLAFSAEPECARSWPNARTPLSGWTIRVRWSCVR